jgi:hypothetical protein
MQVSDELKPRGSLPANYGSAIFDPAALMVLSSSWGLKGRGIEQGPEGWRKIWIDLATSSGEMVLTFGLFSSEAGESFKGDGLGLTFGGIELAEQNAITAETVLADLPPLTTSGFSFIGIQGLNAVVEARDPVVPGPILHLVAAPTSGPHYFAAHSTTLKKNQVYRIAAWVKVSPGAKVQMQVSDELKPRGSLPANYGSASFDLATNTVLSSSGGLKGRGIEQGPEGWRKIWVDLATSGGEMVLTLRLVSSEAGESFKGDGQLGLTFGGIELAEQNAVTAETVLADSLTTSGFAFMGIQGLNAVVEARDPVVPGPILHLVAAPTSGPHYFAAQSTTLKKNQVYRIAAWVKVSPGAKVQMQVSDELKPRGSLPANYGSAIFDPVALIVLSSSGGLKGRGIEQGPEGWRKIWVDLATSGGEMVLAIRLISSEAGESFKGDGQLGLTFGGIELAEHN